MKRQAIFTCGTALHDHDLTIVYKVSAGLDQKKGHRSESVLRPTLRIVETRSGKRVTYQDTAARKAAR